MKKLKKMLSIEAIAANFAVILSICAIVISYVEVNTLQEQKHSEVWPRVYSSSTTNSSDKLFALNIHNKGVGPAIIKYVELKIDGKHHFNWKSAVEASIGKKLEKLNYSSSTLTNATLTPNETLRMFKVEGIIASELIKNRRFEFSVCYCSIFERCWLLKNNSSLGFPEPKAVEECAADPKTRFRR